MSYHLTWRCDHPGCSEWDDEERPEPSSMLGQHVPEGWQMVRAELGDPYYVYCPDHKV